MKTFISTLVIATILSITLVTAVSCAQELPRIYADERARLQ